MKKNISFLLLGFCVFFLLGMGGLYTADYILLNQYIDIVGTTAPAVSNSSQGRLYFDSTYNTFQYSGNSGGFNSLTPHPYNYLVNGSFDFFQRFPTGGSYNAASVYAGYVADRWYLTSSNAAVADCVSTFSNLAGTTNSSGNKCLIKQANASSRYIAMSQVVESQSVYALRNRTVTFQCNTIASGIAIRFAILSTKASSADSFTKTQLDWANTWTSTTYTTGNFFKATQTGGTGTVTYTVVAVSGSIAGAGTSNVKAISGVVPTDALNLICCIWSDGLQAQNNNFGIAQCGLYDGNGIVPWLPRSAQQELALCQRYCCCFSGGHGSNELIGSGVTTAVNAAEGMIPFPVTMRTTPTFTYNGVAAHFGFSTPVAAGAVSTMTAAAGLNGPYAGFLQITATVGSPWAGGQLPGWFEWQSGSSTDVLVFDADY